MVELPPVRRHLPLVASIWLVFQAGVIAATPFIDCCASAAQSATEEDDCCKGLAPGQMCPLHKHRHAPQSDTQHQDQSGPAIRCGCTVLDPAFVSLTFGLGEPPSSVSCFVTVVSDPVRVATLHPRDLDHPVETPPPRA